MEGNIWKPKMYHLHHMSICVIAVDGNIEIVQDYEKFVKNLFS